MRWLLTWRADTRLAAIADRHYSRRTPGAAQFAPAGPVVPLITGCQRAGWVTWSTDFPDSDRLRESWVCSLFRNEGAGLSSELILEALAATRSEWGDPPAAGTVTFVDPARVRSARPGACFRIAGFEREGLTAGGHGRPRLLVLRLAAELHPPAAAPLARVRPGAQLALGVAA
jgi:hypothetical protein